MIRLVLLFSILAAPLAAQTAISERPGRWLSVPQSNGPVLEAPPPGPLITADPTPGVILIAPEPNVDLAIVNPPAPAVPETRPVPRPFTLAVERALEEQPEQDTAVTPVAEVPPAQARAAAVALAAPIHLPSADTVPVRVPLPDRAAIPEPLVTPEQFASPEPIPAAAPVAAVAAVAAVAPAIEVAALAPVPTPEPVPVIVPERVEAALPATDQPETLFEADVTVALAQALAEQLGADAMDIAVTSPREVPVAETIDPADALAPVRPVVIPEVAAPAPPPARVLTPPLAVPVLRSALVPAMGADASLQMAAVLLPAQGRPNRPVAQPVAFVMPPRETAPILPHRYPAGPAAMEHASPLRAPQAEPSSAALRPTPATRPAPLPSLARSAAPSFDPFPMSALPPSALPEGPESLTRTIQPPRPFAEANAAILTGLPPAIPVRMPLPTPSTAPRADAPVIDPDPPAQLPAPDPDALARMVEHAMICWRHADLSAEAQWARLSVDVALDETNLPSAQSIRLTGFGHVVSGAAENAYRAAHGALVGCGEATENAPATTSTTLVFDRNGVRLR